MPCTCTHTTPSCSSWTPKRENADEKVHPEAYHRRRHRRSSWHARTRTCTCSFERGRVYGVPFLRISVTEKYRRMVDGRITSARSALRRFFQTSRGGQFSRYPYIVFEDTVRRTRSRARIPWRTCARNHCRCRRPRPTTSLSYSRRQGHLLQPGFAQHREDHDSPDFSKTVRWRSAA